MIETYGVQELYIQKRANYRGDMNVFCVLEFKEGFERSELEWKRILDEHEQEHSFVYLVEYIDSKISTLERLRSLRINSAGTMYRHFVSWK